MEIIKKRTRKKDWFCLEIDNGTSTMCLVVGTDNKWHYQYVKKMICEDRIWKYHAVWIIS